MILYLLYECSAGYALFEKLEFDEVNATLAQIQKQITNLGTFSEYVRLKAFQPFHSAEVAQDNAVKLSEGQVSEQLSNFLEFNLPKQKKKKGSKIALAVIDKILAGNLSQQFGIECKTSDVITELFRGIKTHFVGFLKLEDFTEKDLRQACLGLGHAFSRTRVALDINRQDKHIIQSAAVIEQLDKELNTFSMRIKEWFSWHFPELAKIVTDNEIYARIVQLIENKGNVMEDKLEELEELTHDADIAQKIVDAAKLSMGSELNELDQLTLKSLADLLVEQFDFKKDISAYLKDRMNKVAPNLTELIGEFVAAKLITQAGSLISLAKYPASTIQILGAEKALFRALKTKGNTPKYGLLYNASYINRAQAKDKGKISRYLANKCSLAARIDQFLLQPTNKFGIKLKDQVNRRLKFLTTGEPTEKNLDVMTEVLDELKDEGLYVESEGKKITKKKTKKTKIVQEEEADEEEEEVKPKKKKVKKVKKSEEIQELEKPKKKVKK